LFATSNKHKVAEANVIGTRFGVTFKQLELSYPEVRDKSVSVVALEGAKYVYNKVGKPMVVEDSGLFIRALNGFPGSYSRLVFDSIGIQGILDLMRGRKDRQAFFLSAMAFYDGKTLKAFEGRVDGLISRKPAGSSGFGFDPVFTPKGGRKTFAEDLAFKNKVSHRVKSVEKFCKWFMKRRL
jgi:XTP/dITP diphosphohydrolase